MVGKKAGNTGIFIVLTGTLLLVFQDLKAQVQPDFFNDSVSIRECISYALKHQPVIKQLRIDEEIADQSIKASLSDWFPQVRSSAGYQHYLKQPVSVFPNFSDPQAPKIEVTTGVKNYSSIQFSASQNLFNNQLILAGRTAKYYRQQVKQSTEQKTIQLVVSISKAFYDVLLTSQMLNIIKDDIDRLSVSLKDALAMYNNGLRDKIDYSRATLALNSARSQKISVTNAITDKLTNLKQMMGYPEEKPLILKSAFNDMKNDILIDTLQNIRYSDRIEYRLLQTNILLQRQSLGYYRQSFLPELSAYANYNYVFQNDDFSQLYRKSFPNSTIGLSFSLPLFEGAGRIHELKRSRLTYDRLVLDTINLKNEMNSGYVSALSSYKSNLAAYNLTERNIEIAHEVYNTVMSQYKEGIKPYLEVIISETDLRNAQLNNLSSLIMLMFSKIDVDQALGKIYINY